MVKFRGLIYIIISILLIGIAFAVTSQVSSFTGQSNPFNITFTGNENYSYILPIPSYGYVQNVSLSLTGFQNNASSSFAFTYVPSLFNMSDTCQGQIALEPTSTYDLQVCLADINNNTISESCKTYTSGNFSVGSYISTEVFNTNVLTIGQSYRFMFHWKRIQYVNMNNSALNGYNDSGQTYDTNIFDVCNPWTSSTVYAYDSNNGGCTGSRTDYTNKAAYWAIYSGAGCSGTSYTFAYPSQIIDSCRAYENANLGGVNATGTKTECINAAAVTNPGCFSPTGFPFNDFYQVMSNCVAGTPPVCPSSLCTYSGDTTQYSNPFILGTDTNTTFSGALNVNGNITFSYPSNVDLYLNNLNQKAYTGDFSNNQIISLNISLINSLLSSFQPINLTFHSDTAGILQVNLTNATYSYGIDNCSNSFNIPSNKTSFGYLIKDEDNSSVIPTADLSGTITYGITTATQTNTIDLDFTNKYNYTYCIYPNWSSYYIDYNLNYEADDYPQRSKVIDNYFVNNVLTVIDLYLLKSSEGIYARFKTVDQDENVLSGTDVQMADLSGNIIELQQTDDSGLATLWVDPNQQYVFTFSKTGYETQVKTLRPTTSEIFTVIMPSEGEEVNQSIHAGLSYGFSPKNQVLQNNTEYDLGFNISSSYWSIDDCDLYILDNESTILDNIAGTFTSLNCSSLITISTGNHSVLIAHAVVSLNGTEVDYYKTYNVRYSYTGQFSLKNFLDDITQLSTAGFGTFTRLFIALVLIIVLTFSASEFLGMNNGEMVLLLILGLVWLVSYIGWFTLNYANLPNFAGLPQYAIAYLITILVGAYLIDKHTR